MTLNDFERLRTGGNLNLVAFYCCCCCWWWWWWWRCDADSAAVTPGTGLLPTISSLRHIDLLSDSVTLEWEPTPIVEPRHRLKSYVVERYAEEPPPPRWERLAALPITVTRYTVPGLSPGRRYKFRVFAETHEGLTGSPYEYEPPQYMPHIGGTCLAYRYWCADGRLGSGVRVSASFQIFSRSR